MNALGEEAACRAAATTSSAGAVFGTKALAPASRAPKSWSSPAYMVSTTMPIDALDLRSARVASRPLPSGSRRSMITTSGCRAPAWRTPSAAVAASPTTSNWRSRSNACRRPLRIRSWSSTSRTLVRVAGSDLWSSSGYSPSAAAALPRTLSRRAEVPSTTATVVPLGRRGLISSRPRIRSALSAMIARPYRPSGRWSADAVTVIRHFDLCVRRVDLAA